MAASSAFSAATGLLLPASSNGCCICSSSSRSSISSSRSSRITCSSPYFFTCEKAIKSYSLFFVPAAFCTCGIPTTTNATATGKKSDNNDDTDYWLASVTDSPSKKGGFRGWQEIVERGKGRRWEVQEGDWISSSCRERQCAAIFFYPASLRKDTLRFRTCKAFVSLNTKFKTLKILMHYFIDLKVELRNQKLCFLRILK